MESYFVELAEYNRWANRRLYKALTALADDAYHQHRAAFFGSIHGTLNHILVADRIWLGRILDEDPGISALDEILYPDLRTLTAARDSTDQQIIDVVGCHDAASLESHIRYSTLGGEAYESSLRWILAHVFNHQTHHRGQVHNMLSQSGAEPPPLDLMLYLRAL